MSRTARDRRLFPVFLDLADKKCVVVGAGEIAERKVRSLLETGALIVAIGPEATEFILKSAERGELTLAERDFKPGDLDGAHLAIAATDDPAVNRAVAEAALDRGVPVNAADRPELCDFFLPAVARRGRLQIAVSTGGASPALARRLKEDILGVYGPEYADYVEVIARFRERIRERVPDARARNQIYRRLFESDLLDRVKGGPEIDIEGLVEQYASS